MAWSKALFWRPRPPVRWLSTPPKPWFSASFGAALDILIKGLITGSSLMVGAYLAKGFILQPMPPERFKLLMDGLLFSLQQHFAVVRPCSRTELPVREYQPFVSFASTQRQRSALIAHSGKCRIGLTEMEMEQFEHRIL